MKCQNYLLDYDHQNIVKRHRNMNFEQKEIMNFDYCEEYFKDYIRQNIIMAVIRKPNAYSLVICKLIKK